MSDLISREQAIDIVEKYDFDFPQYMKRFVTELRDAMKTDIIHDLKHLPSADRPTGEWIWSPKDKDGTVSGCCSNCSFSHLFIGGHTAQYNFCPNCGAKMGGDSDG